MSACNGRFSFMQARPEKCREAHSHEWIALEAAAACDGQGLTTNDRAALHPGLRTRVTQQLALVPMLAPGCA